MIAPQEPLAEPAARQQAREAAPDVDHPPFRGARLGRLPRRQDLGVVLRYIGKEAAAVGVCSALDGCDRIILAYRGHGYHLTRTSTTSSLRAAGERPHRQINDHRARALCHPGPPTSSRRLSRSAERTDGGVSPAIRPARSGQIVEVDVERGGDLLQRVDRASALAVLDLRQGSRYRSRRARRAGAASAAMLAPDSERVLSGDQPVGHADRASTRGRSTSTISPKSTRRSRSS